MSTMTKALARSRSVVDESYHSSLSLKAAGMLDLSPSPGFSQFNQFSDDSKSRERYSLFRGWLYSAVNALSAEAAGQPVVVAKIKGKSSRPSEQKMVRSRMTTFARTKSASQEFEVLIEHPLLDLLEQPNPIQTRWSFVYSFVANLNLTGWSYVVGGRKRRRQVRVLQPADQLGQAGSHRRAVQPFQGRRSDQAEFGNRGRRVADEGERGIRDAAESC